MIYRRLDAADKRSLATFTCATGPGYARDVQNYIRVDLQHKLELGVSEGRALTPRFVPAAICAFQRIESDAWYINVLGVDLSVQRRGLGALLFDQVLAELARRTPGAYAHWRVDAGNSAAHALSLAAGAEPNPVPRAGLMTYFLSL